MKLLQEYHPRKRSWPAT